MTAARSRRTWTWRSSSPTSPASRRGARSPRKRGKLRGIGISNTIEQAAAPSYEGAEIRFDRSGAVTLLSGTITQGQGHETAFKQIVCDRLGLDPREVHVSAGRYRPGLFGEGTGGSRSATIGGSAFLLATDKIMAKAKALAAHMLKVPLDDIKFADGIFSSPKTNQTLTINEVAKAAAVPAKLPKGMEPGLDRHRGLRPQDGELSRTAAMSASSRSTPTPARSRSCATAWSTTSAP